MLGSSSSRTLPRITSSGNVSLQDAEAPVSARDYRTVLQEAKDNAKGDTPQTQTPRRAVLRSRVLIARNQRGGFTVMPSWKDPHMSASSSTATLLPGEGRLPVQAVMPKPPNNFSRPKVDNVPGKVLLAANIPGTGKGHSARFGAIWHPEMTNEFHADLKLRLNNLAQFCRGGDMRDLVANPRRLDHFLRQLGELSEFMEMTLTDKSFRRCTPFSKFQSFLRSDSVPNVLEVWAGLTELPINGFLVFTILLALTDTSWKFCYNSITHKICDCAERFGVNYCLSSTAPQSAVKEKMASEDIRRSDPSRQARIEKLQREERHFPLKLFELSSAVKTRFLDLVKQIPKKLEEFLSLTIPPSTLMWERFVINFTSHVTVFDQYYSRFELMYLGLVDKMISSAMAPLHSMTDFSSQLIRAPSDSFRPMQTSMLCQRLGILKHQVAFGGSIGLTDFDPMLLAKAKRILSITTYSEVQAMAQQLIERFDQLCQLLEGIKDDEIKPELSNNLPLKQAVLSLEKIWDRCQYVLVQKALDFIDELVKYIQERLDVTMRWKLKRAVAQDFSRQEPAPVQRPPGKFSIGVGRRHVLPGTGGVPDLDAIESMFSTLPILMYLDEMQKDVGAEQRGEIYFSNFRDLFCPDENRYHRLKSEIGKFDERRFQTLYDFVLGEKPETGNDQMQYFVNVYKQLKEAAAFDLSVQRFKLTKAQLYSREQWICVHQIVQKVRPDLFPAEDPNRPPESLPCSPAGRNSGGDRRLSGVSFQNASSNSRQRSQTKNERYAAEEETSPQPSIPRAGSKDKVRQGSVVSDDSTPQAKAKQWAKTVE